MAGASPREKVVGRGYCRGIDPLGTPNLLDYVTKGHVHEIPVQMASADAARQRHLANLTQKSRAEPERRADDAFRKRQQVGS